MKSREVPTSPKHRPHTEEIDALYKMEPTITKPGRPGGAFIFGMVALSMLVTLAVVIGLRFAADRYPTVPLFKYFRASTSTTERVIVPQPSIAQDDVLSETIARVAPSLGAVVTSEHSVVRKVDDVIGNAVVISNDGSAITMTGTSTLGATSMVRFSNGVEQLLRGPQVDPATGAVFIDLNVSTTPVAFADSDRTAIGDRIMVLRYHAYAGNVEYVPTAVMGLQERISVPAGNDSLVESSETLNRQIRLTDQLDPSWTGAGAYDMKGRLVGIISGTAATEGTYLIPINSLKRLITKYVAGEPVQRATLGVSYVDLSYNSTIDPYPSKGAYLFSIDKKTPAISPKSPASAAGLQPNDVITTVDTAPLNELRSLSDAIASYAPNSKVELTVIRNTKEIKVTVTLGTHPAKN